MGIMQRELNDLRPRMKVTKASWQEGFRRRKKTAATGLEKMVANDPVLSLFEFYNDNHAVASASIGQVGRHKNGFHPARNISLTRTHGVLNRFTRRRSGVGHN
jgi:hypothetical protein